MDYLQTNEEKTLNFDNEAINAAYQKNNGTQSLAIKILSVFGGILASWVFWGFIIVAELYESETVSMILGVILFASAIYMSKKFDRKIIFDTIIVSLFISGFILIGFAFDSMDMNKNTICILSIIIAFLSIFITQKYIISFISTLIISGNILGLILLNSSYDFIHIYIAVFVAVITYFFLNEAKIISANNILSKLYNPIRTGLIFSFVAGLTFVGIRWLHFVSYNFIWLSSIATICAVIYLFHNNLFEIFKINKRQHKILIYIFIILVLLPTAFSPAISGTILLILLSFYVNYKTGLVLGIISFIYFISQYYYDLNLTLLTKSILMFSSGIIFLIIYLFTSKKLMTNEKI